jgi:hypothetical protein
MPAVFEDGGDKPRRSLNRDEFNERDLFLMNSRERTLAMVVAGLVVVGGIAFLANAMFLQPLSRLDKQIADRNSTVQTRLGEIAAEKKYLDAIKKLNPGWPSGKN